MMTQPLWTRVNSYGQTFADDIRALADAIARDRDDNAIMIAERIQEDADTLAWLVRTTLRPGDEDYGRR